MIIFRFCLEVSGCILKSWSLVPCLEGTYWTKALSLPMDLVSFQTKSAGSEDKTLSVIFERAPEPGCRPVHHAVFHRYTYFPFLNQSPIPQVSFQASGPKRHWKNDAARKLPLLVVAEETLLGERELSSCHLTWWSGNSIVFLRGKTSALPNMGNTECKKHMLIE